MCHLPVRKKGSEKGNKQPESRGPAEPPGSDLDLCPSPRPCTLTPPVSHPRLLCPTPDEMLPASCPLLPNHAHAHTPLCTHRFMQPHVHTCALHPWVCVCIHICPAASFLQECFIVSRCAMKFAIRF